jgi:putative transposase
MPWRDRSPMDLRMLFVSDFCRGVTPVAELCRRYGISRKTGYKWIRRYELKGPFGLGELSRRPLNSPQQTSERIVEAIVALRKRHPTWGAKKLLRILAKNHPLQELPARSTVCGILKRRGLTKRRGRHRKLGVSGKPRTGIAGPNEVWAADFKGWFYTQNRRACHPLTITDAYSRYLLCCCALTRPLMDLTIRCFERTFQEYGLPRAIRTDNGLPFASTSLGRISRLSAWWIDLGIEPELIQPGHPEQNGQHERMHRTLKQETTKPPARNLSAQQMKFDDFRDEFNYERPHESLGQRTPGSFYRPSPRSYSVAWVDYDYPAEFEIKRVNVAGGIRWKGKDIRVSSVLAGRCIGLEPIRGASGEWWVYYRFKKLGILREKTSRIESIRNVKVSPMSSD